MKENDVGYDECVVNSNPFYSEETVHTASHILRDYGNIQISGQPGIGYQNMTKGGVTC